MASFGAEGPSPSGRDGMSVADEKKARRRTCLFIDTCGKELKLPKLPARARGAGETRRRGGARRGAARR